MSRTDTPVRKSLSASAFLPCNKISEKGKCIGKYIA